MQLENSKGTRDFAPEEKIARNNIVSALQRVFELYGYSPLETPIIEKYELMLAKGGAGEESDAMKEVFKLSDQGGRQLALKFEQTLSLARYIGMNPNVKMPFKRYETGPVFRDGPIKLGRYRQFWQCDVDVVGTKSMASDAELIRMALDSFRALGIDAFVEFNNRKLLKGIIEFAGIKENLAGSVIIIIDKLNKIGYAGVQKELKIKGIPDGNSQKLLSAFNLKGTNKEKLNTLKGLIGSETGKEGIREVEEVLSYLKEEDKNVVFNVSLARGLGYYTGTIFEGFARDSPIKSSVCGGGRYDDMIASLLKSGKEYPCAGISFGLDVLYDVLKNKKQPTSKSVVKAYVIPIKTLKQCFLIAEELRSQGINTDMDCAGRGLSKNLDFANTLKIPYAVIVGERELKEGTVKLKDMLNGDEYVLTLQHAINKIKKI